MTFLLLSLPELWPQHSRYVDFDRDFDHDRSGRELDAEQVIRRFTEAVEAGAKDLAVKRLQQLLGFVEGADVGYIDQAQRFAEELVIPFMKKETPMPDPTEPTPTTAPVIGQDRLNLLGELEVALKVAQLEASLRVGFANVNPLPDYHPAVLRVRRLCAAIWGEEP